jgi:hypothetical protein
MCPDDLSHLLEELGHTVTLLRKVLPKDTADESVLQFAYDNDCTNALDHHILTIKISAATISHGRT